jgi:nucleoid-associated protein YgaU
MADREDEVIEIVKRIESPRRESEELEEKKEEIVYIHETLTTNETDTEEKKTSKKVLPILFGITTVGVIGYFGFKHFDNEKINHTQNIKTPTVNTEKKEPQEITTYTEELAITKDSQKIEESVVATLSEQQAQAQLAQEKKQKEISKPIPIEQVKELKETPPKIEKSIEEEKIVLKKKEITQEKKEIIPEKKIVQKPKNVLKKEIKKKTYQLYYETIKPRVVIVQKGDSLASIAKRFYGNPMDFKRIVHANSRIRSHKTSLRLGEKIIIPRKDNKKTRRYIIVEKGNTLASISKKVYGSTDKISKIVRANYKIKSKQSTLRLGQKVYVPK